MSARGWLDDIVCAASFFLLASTLLACGRKAPGPEECAHFAELTAQLSGGPILTPQVQAQIDDETRQCLTTPYDRELLNCVETTQEARACLLGFRRRARSGK